MFVKSLSSILFGMSPGLPLDGELLAAILAYAGFLFVTRRSPKLHNAWEWVVGPVLIVAVLVALATFTGWLRYNDFLSLVVGLGAAVGVRSASLLNVDGIHASRWKMACATLGGSSLFVALILGSFFAITKFSEPYLYGHETAVVVIRCVIVGSAVMIATILVFRRLNGKKANPTLP